MTLSSVLLAALLALPLLSGLALLALRPVERRAHLAARWASGLVALSAWVLLLAAPRLPAPALSVTWLPGMGAIGFALGSSSLWVAALTATAAWACLMLSCDLPRVTPILILFGLAAAHLALVVDHFLARYLALELLGLLVAGAWLFEHRGSELAVRRARWVYLLLRVGDAGFLVALLMLHQATGTLDIAQSLAAGAALAPSHLRWILGGLLLAVWLKVGAWPLHGWAASAGALSTPSRAWLYGTAMPNLGLYLLVRIVPLLDGEPVLRAVLLWGGLFSAAVTVLSALLPAARQRASARSLDHGLAAQSALALVLASSGDAQRVWLALLLLTPARLLVHILERQPRGRARQALAGLLGAGLAAFWLALYAGLWDTVPPGALVVVFILVSLTALWALRLGTSPAGSERGGRALPEEAAPAGGALEDAGLPRWLGTAPAAISRFESDVLEQGLAAFTRAAAAVSRAIYRFESDVLERGLAAAARAVGAASTAIYRFVELGGLESLLRGAARLARGAGLQLQRQHTGRLRLNLIWVLVSLVVVAALVLSG